MVEATLNYLAPMPERPVYYTYPPPAGERFRNTRGDRRTVAIQDARALEPAADLDERGFGLAQLETGTGGAPPRQSIEVRTLAFF